MTFSLLPITIIPVKKFQQNDVHVQVSHSLIKYWEIDTSKPLILTVGRNQIVTRVRGEAITKDEIFLAENIFSELFLPLKEAQWIASFSRKDNRLTLGPVIGVLTEIDQTGEEPHFRTIHTFCRELHDHMADIGGFLYVFQLSDFSDGKLNGYYLENNRWQKSSVPLPNVIYNRIHSRKLEASPFFQQFKTMLLTENIAIFNDRFLSKEIVHQILYSEEYMQPYLPETSLLTEQSLQVILEKYHSIFIKPIHGSQGRNIIKVSKENNQLSAKLSTGMGKDNILSFGDFSQFHKWLKPFLKRRKYIVQQAIPLITYKERQLDFRILCHKNFQDAWKATSAVARISADQQFVSNIARGGDMMRPLHILSLLSDRSIALQQLELMKELAVEIASLICQTADGLVGELGIDIGVDEDGKLWIIEVNSKPSKNIEEGSKKIRPSAKALLEYCTFLSFGARRNE
ncbi:YheC/YheD family protein [Cytobacillus sp. FJAT-53684]|uniref:YheC/YheD family protein n=1 Tax=Cytobacillus mangrovibacter TaxID=3299024 RepID=A0ABW6JZT3_9BACI